MTGYLDKLNLRPFEKRLVVGAAAAVFVVINLLLVFPHFSDWNKVKGRMYKAQKTLSTFQTEIGDMRRIQVDIKKLEDESGTAVPLEDQAAQFQRSIQSQAVASGVNITGTSKPQTRTNDAFFIEQSQTISIVSQEAPLVDFLYKLGVGNSLIRVRELTLKPDAPRQQLAGNIKLVASYQKKAAARLVTPPVTSPPPRVTPAAPKPSSPLGKAGSLTKTTPSHKPATPSNQPLIQPVKRP